MYEQGVIRPPSEAQSLLLRVTRNCPWNQCLFCPAYKGVKFSRRSVEEVKKDIDSMVREYANHINVIRSVFLQDADSLVLKTDDILEILRYLRSKFPNIERITTYARSTTLKRKTVDEFRQLKEAGLTRIHAGMESGSEKVLKLIKKGITPADIIEAGTKVIEAGISLSEYIMPGVAGRTLSEEHARETARVLNAVHPDFIRVRTFALHPKSPMQNLVREGTIVPMTDEEIVREIRLLVSDLNEMHSYFSCGDYGPNLLMQVDGYLDEKKAAMLSEIDKYLSLTPDQRKVYSFIRRSSFMNYPLDIVFNEEVMGRLLPEIRRLENEPDGFNKYIADLMSQTIPQPQTDGEWN
ncbi:MAG TPA: radical SAM protein [Syntrophorhabdaceae bacterium]|nr:radical SAM protein [Syntrophorhabdaceae bacterium]